MIYDELQLFRGHDYKVNDYITVHHPRLGEICDFGEQKYYNMVSSLCSTPFDYKALLFDSGIDYEAVDEFDFFITMWSNLNQEDASLLFPDLNVELFKPAKNEESGEVVLFNQLDGSVIDFVAYNLITDFLRKINGFKKSTDRAANAITKQILIEEDKKYIERNKDKPYKSTLVPLISSMTNCEQFKYNHETVWELPIYTFMDSVSRIQKIKNYDQVMQGVFSGSLEYNKLNKEDINWLG